ncbi:MAG TPA: MaoC/PaaZ C-terminal domain-containing protein [Jatrophihabitantaceae bacterium]|jgi:acyl dehydratase
MTVTESAGGTVKHLSAPPSLLPLYARAAVTGPLHRGGESLPDTTYELSEQQIDPAHLTAYERVCGFRTSDVLPPTYLHVLAFPLSVALMTQPAFPFPLVGMVHVGNTITVHRDVRSDEAVAFSVRAGNLRAHPAGRQFDLLAEARVGDEAVWSGRSTYLRRGKAPKEAGAGGAGGSDEGDKKRRPKPIASEPAGPVAQVRVPDDVGRRYAAVSGDRNPIHMHSLAARAFGFPKAIAHGMWLKARTLATLEGRLPDSFVVDVSFKTPVFLPSTIAITSTADGNDWLLDVRNAKSGKPHLTGNVRAG